VGILSRIMRAVRSGLSADYGRFERSREVERAFESCQVLADFNYYYSGPDVYPSAILGIHREYALRSRLWKKLDLTEAQLKAWVGEMSDSIDSAPMYRGFFILDHKGKHIGVFYSPEKTMVRIEPDNEVVVGVPTEIAKLEQGS
jgi:hypothetical protein